MEMMMFICTNRSIMKQFVAFRDAQNHWPDRYRDYDGSSSGHDRDLRAFMTRPPRWRSTFMMNS
jgi:hypothetical protein